MKTAVTVIVAVGIVGALAVGLIVLAAWARLWWWRREHRRSQP